MDPEPSLSDDEPSQVDFPDDMALVTYQAS